MAVACVTGLSVHFPGSCQTAVAVPAVAAVAGLEHRQMTDGEGEEAKLKSLVGRCQPLQGRNEEAGRSRRDRRSLWTSVPGWKTTRWVDEL